MKPDYLCFTANHVLESALQTFRDRYHCEPQEHKLEHGILFVGPIPGSEQPYYLETPHVDIFDQDGNDMQLVMF
jgi:hypothetical protein